jgi:peroxiredoxin
VGAERPGVGDKAPDFSLPSLAGESVRLSEITENGPVVLVVLRGYPGYQCPICNRQVQEFLRSARGFSEAGAQVLMVYPGPDEDLVSRAREFAADKQFPENFRLLLDPGYTFTNLYGLRWDAPRETAYPSTCLIDRDGAIFFAKISDSHGGRTTAVEVLDALKQKSQRR